MWKISWTQSGTNLMLNQREKIKRGLKRAADIYIYIFLVFCNFNWHMPPDNTEKLMMPVLGMWHMCQTKLQNIYAYHFAPVFYKWIMWNTKNPTELEQYESWRSTNIGSKSRKGTGMTREHVKTTKQMVRLTGIIGGTNKGQIEMQENTSDRSWRDK